MQFSIFPPKADHYDNFQFLKRQKSKGFTQHYFFNPKNSAGFTIIELTVVLAIMGLLIGLVIVDFARQRPARDLKIAQNELVTNIRKVQSYSLFSRNINNLKPAQYYVLKFDIAKPDRYFIQAITDVYSAPTLVDMETVLLPKNIVLDATSQLVFTRPVQPLSATSPCGLLAFKSPYGRAIMNHECNISSPAFQNTDAYQEIIDLLSNVANISASVDSDLLITLSFVNGGGSKQVLVKGITGLVCPTVNGTVCSF